MSTSSQSHSEKEKQPDEGTRITHHSLHYPGPQDNLTWVWGREPDFYLCIWVNTEDLRSCYLYKGLLVKLALNWNLGTWLPVNSQLLRVAPCTSSVSAHTTVCAKHLVSSWTPAVWVCAGQRVPRPVPSEDLGCLISNGLPWAEISCSCCYISVAGKRMCCDPHGRGRDGSLHVDPSRLCLSFPLWSSYITVMDLSHEDNSMLSPESPCSESSNPGVVLGTPPHTPMSKDLNPYPNGINSTTSSNIHLYST